MMTSIKDKIAAVRNVVSNYSNDEIVLVLQHHEFDVDKTINNFVEGQVTDILNEWEHTGPKSSKSKKKKKKAQQKKRQAEVLKQNAEILPKTNISVNGVAKSDMLDQASQPNTLNSSNESNFTDTVTQSQAAVALKYMLTNGTGPDRSIPSITNSTTNDVKEMVKDSETPPNDLKSKSSNETEKLKEEKMHRSHPLYSSGHRSRTSSESSTKVKAANRRKQKAISLLVTADGQEHNDAQSSQNQSAAALNNKKSIEKAVRDLQRCSVSFGRYKSLLNEEINDSYKRIKEAFEEVVNALNEREVTLIRKLDEMKEEAFALLAKRESRALELKKQTDRVGTMNQHQVSELRNEIKHFVAERKYDEELGRTTRFSCDKDIALKVIPTFGEISAVKNSYSSRPLEQVKPTRKSDTVVDSNIPAVVDLPPSPNVVVDASLSKSDVKKHVATKGNATNAKQHEPNETSWADATDHHPLPEIPASWNQENHVAGGDPVDNDSEALKWSDGRKPRRQRSNRGNNHPDGNKEQDKTLMPPPQRIPASKGASQSENRDPRAEEQKFNYKPVPRSNHKDNSANGYRNSRGRGSFRGNYRGGPRGGFRNGPNDRYYDTKSYPTRDFNNHHSNQTGNYSEFQTNSLPQRNKHRNSSRENKSGDNWLSKDRRPNRENRDGHPNKPMHNGDGPHHHEDGRAENLVLKKENSNSVNKEKIQVNDHKKD